MTPTSRQRPATFAKRIVRVAWLVCALGIGSLGLVASCSSSAPSQGAPSDAGGQDRTSEGSAADCPLPVPDSARCTGGDPGFVFFPPVMCDPEVREASPTATPTDAAADSGADGGDPCDGLVTTFSVFFSTQACASFASAESTGAVGADTDPGAPVFSDPIDGAMLSSDNWAFFVWARHATDARRGPVDRALDFLEPSALASTPLSGDAYVLEFSQGCKEVLRVMVTSEFWDPDVASWSVLTSLVGPVRVQVFWMRFQNDALTVTPIPSVPITITMQDSARD